MISVAMASYNGEKYILEQLESIYNQTVKVDEIVIVDDCSQDGTVAVIKEFMDNHPNCNVRLCENETNLGYKRNFYKAMSLCEGDIIFLCDQDDIWREKKVEVLTEVLNSNSDIALVSSSFIQINGEGKEASDNKSAYKRKMKADALVSVPLQDLIFHNISQGCAMAFRKEIKDIYMQFWVEELPHDWILNIIAAMRKKCYYLNSATFYYRIHDKNTIGLNEGLTLNKKNSLEVRSYDATQAIKVLDLIEKVDCNFYQENAWLVAMKQFSLNHITYLQNKKMGNIIFQNFSPYYRKLKTVRGRLLDMFFCVKNKSTKEAKL